MLNKQVKTDLIKKFAQKTEDTGSSQVQVALLSERIRQISEHLKKFPKDNHSQRGLMGLVGKRRTFLAYVKKNDFKGYTEMVNLLKANGYM